MSDKLKQLLFTISGLTIIALYFAGIVLMICRQTSIGIGLWGISTIIGAFFLYVRYKRRKIREDAEAEEAEEEERRRRGETD